VSMEKQTVESGNWALNLYARTIHLFFSGLILLSILLIHFYHLPSSFSYFLEETHPDLFLTVRNFSVFNINFEFLFSTQSDTENELIIFGLS